MTFYRIDFPSSYLGSIRKGVQPKEHLTIFRFVLSQEKHYFYLFYVFRIGGDRAKITKRMGFKLTDHGEQRAKAFTILCNIINFCSTNIYPFCAQKQEPLCSETRVAALGDTYIL